MALDLAAALDAALQHARVAREHLRLDGGDADHHVAVRVALSGVEAMLGAAVTAAPNEMRFQLADARSKIAALLLAADQLEELVGEVHARRLRIRAAVKGASVASRYLRGIDTSIAV